MNSFVNDIFGRIAAKASHLVHYNKRWTAEIQAAVRLLLLGELAKRWGNKSRHLVHQLQVEQRRRPALRVHYMRTLATKIWSVILAFTFEKPNFKLLRDLENYKQNYQILKKKQTLTSALSLGLILWACSESGTCFLASSKPTRELLELGFFAMIVMESWSTRFLGRPTLRFLLDECDCTGERGGGDISSHSTCQTIQQFIFTVHLAFL